MAAGKKYLILFLILLFPSLLYVMLSKGKHKFKEIAIYGPKEVDATGDTLYHIIPDFEFTNQYGERIQSSKADNSYSIVNFFFTSCKTICIPMNQEMNRVYHEFKDRKDVVLYSITVDPETDSVQALLNYAQQFPNLEKGKWQFLTGAKQDIYTLAQKHFFLTAMQDTLIPDFIHDDRIVILDKERRIRGFYTATNKEEVKRLIDELKVLLFKEVEIPRKAS